MKVNTGTVELYGTPDEDASIVRGFEEWAEGFAEPDEPVSESLLGTGLSPRQLAYEVRAHTSVGRNQVNALRRMAERTHQAPQYILERLTAAHHRDGPTRTSRTLGRSLR
jgi:hypothetical protein